MSRWQAVKKWTDIAIGTAGLAAAFNGMPMKPEEIRAHQEEIAQVQRMQEVERNTDARVSQRYVPVEPRPFDEVPTRAASRDAVAGRAPVKAADRERTPHRRRSR